MSDVVDPKLPTFKAFTTQDPSVPLPLYGTLEAWKVSADSNGVQYLSYTSMPPLAKPQKLEDGTWLYKTSKGFYHITVVPQIPTGYKTLPAPYTNYRIFSALKNWKRETEIDMGSTRTYITGLDETDTEVKFYVLQGESDEYFIGMFVSGIRINDTAVLLK